MARSAFGSIRQRPDTGRWQARWQDRQQRQHSRTFPTKREAAAWLRAEATRLDDGSWVDRRAGRVTFNEWADQWRATVVGLRRSTLARDIGYVDRYLRPAFGALELAAIDHTAVQRWVAEMAASGRAPATTVKAAQILGKMLRAAMAARLIGADPCALVHLPRVEREEMRCLTPDDVWRLHDAMDDRWRSLVLVGAFGGLRIGELVALEHADIVSGVAHVRRAAVEVAGRHEIGPPKTRAGVRQVPLPSFVVDAIPAGTGLVWTSPRGAMLRRSVWRQRAWLPAVRAARLDGLRIHDLRHTAVSLWLAAGLSPLEVARRAGHTSAAVVLDRYGHLLPGHEDASRLERFART